MALILEMTDILEVDPGAFFAELKAWCRRREGGATRRMQQFLGSA